MPTGEIARSGAGAGMRVWTDEDRWEALELYMLHGTSEASRRTGIPRSTISHWAAEEDLAPKRTEISEALRATYALRKLVIAEGLMDDAERLREQMFAPAKAGHWHEGEYRQEEIPEPTFEDKRAIAQTVSKQLSTAQDLVEGRRANPADAGVVAVQVNINRQGAA